MRKTSKHITITQRSIAKKLNCSESMISAWINDRRHISRKTALQWAQILKISPAKLMFASTADKKSLLNLDD